MPGLSAYLDLGVGPFDLALRATAVVSVAQEVPVLDQTVTIRGAAIPVIDLGSLFGGGARALLPFVITLQNVDHEIALGVDRVTHLRDGAVGLPVPDFGLLRPELFEGAMRQGERLLLVLNPEVITSLGLRARS